MTHRHNKPMTSLESNEHLIVQRFYSLAQRYDRRFSLVSPSALATLQRFLPGKDRELCRLTLASLTLLSQHPSALTLLSAEAGLLEAVERVKVTTAYNDPELHLKADQLIQRLLKGTTVVSKPAQGSSLSTSLLQSVAATGGVVCEFFSQVGMVATLYSNPEEYNTVESRLSWIRAVRAQQSSRSRPSPYWVVSSAAHRCGSLLSWFILPWKQLTLKWAGSI